MKPRLEKAINTCLDALAIVDDRLKTAPPEKEAKQVYPGVLEFSQEILQSMKWELLAMKACMDRGDPTEYLPRYNYILNDIGYSDEQLAQAVKIAIYHYKRLRPQDMLP